MSKKIYKISEEPPMTVGEPAVAYSATTPVSTGWNPNVPFHGTQEEWWEHFRRIEEGEFMTIEEADKKFEIWKKEFLASRT
ncbi:MAG: hypothetical protein FWD09_05990 [Lentimicrobiaceae bacterium]|nr:hypothetical protein [Lentimicrobiaceae bacterium]